MEKCNPKLLHVVCMSSRHCLRTSYGTWLKRQGADMKDIQEQLRHSRIFTTMNIYVRDIPESRRKAVDDLKHRQRFSCLL
jgi:integrase